ncbi:alpha/beta fold hydrolase [Methylococcus sp. EFPC2]|uniref:alpha/beta fold hydrolase n=1 Tax=Methylococcus sp. EFPC2 TaxID=2812648 RepID=UPI0019679211|nr:alpha/beta hydrolase [Methylococcus sp. EFPC2]QSA98273.1 alpha/beta hydrolase [Methylococcus sp. EFPC2]
MTEPHDWLFLRGLGRESAHWDDFPQSFAQGIPAARVHLIDLPGNGRFRHLDSPVSIREMLTFVRREALAASPLRRPFFLFAISLGGMLAWEWAQSYPEELAGLVLVNTSLRGFNPWYRRLAPECWTRLARILACRDDRRRERLILDLTARPHIATPERLATRRLIAQRHPVSAGNVVRQLLAAALYRPSPAAPLAPFLLLNSLGDRMVDPACSQTISARLGAPLATHPEAGHDLPLDDPLWVIAQIRHWLDKGNST